MIWSILIAGVPERYHSCQPLLYSLLETQSVARMPDVELIYALDNKRRTVGAKRNMLLDAARGEYVCFIDDDDSIAPDYVARIHDTLVKAHKADPPVDVITFGQRATIQPQGIVHECSYSLEHWRNRKPEERRQLSQTQQPGVFAWSGPPAHTMVWRRAILDGLRFPEKQFGEDVDWVDAACAKAQSEICLNGGPLYMYNFNQETSATR